LWWLHRRTYRFAESRRLIPEITEKMHNQQLRDIVHGRIYPTVHPGQVFVNGIRWLAQHALQAICRVGRNPNKMYRCCRKSSSSVIERKGKERIRSDQVKNHNWRPDRRPVTIEELLLSSSAQTPLIEKGLISREEFVQKISEGAATHRKLLNFIVQ
jgi:DNA-binding HxlR family transcriptional regulator